MKHLLMLVLLLIAGQLSAKKPAFDSIKSYESATIQYKKKMQGLYDAENKQYIIPLSNVEIYELAKGFYGIADPKTRLVQIIFHNEYYTFKTSWQSKQMVLDKSTESEYPGFFTISTLPSLQMENYLIVEGGLGYSANNQKLGNSTERGFAGIYYTSDKLIILTNNQKWNKIENCNKNHISDLTEIRKSKKNTQIFNQKYLEFYVNADYIFYSNYQLDSNIITENFYNEYEESITKTFKEYSFKLKELKKIDFITNQEQPIDDKDTLTYYFNNSLYEKINRFFEIKRELDFISKFENKSLPKKLMLEAINGIKLYDVNSQFIVIETTIGTKNVIEIDSTKSRQTRNCNNEMDLTLTYIDNSNVMLNWYVYGVGQNSGLWNLTSKTWTIEPSNVGLWYFENKFIKEIYSIANNLNEQELIGYELYDIKGAKINEFNSKPELKDFLSSLLTVDSLSVIDQNVFTYKNGKKGYLFLVGIPTVYPIRVFQEMFDQINVNAYQDLFTLIKDSTISLSHNFRHYKNGLNTFHLINYELNAQKIGFSIYRQNYMYEENKIPDIKLLQVKDDVQKENFKSDFIWTNHNFGYEKLENGNFIIHNVKIQESYLAPIFNEFGDNVDGDGDGVLDYQEIIHQNISRSGLYSLQLKKWIIEPNKNWIGEFNDNYLVSEYIDNYEIKYSIFDKNGNFISTIFDNETKLTDQIKYLYSGDSIAKLNSTIYSVFTKDNHYILDIKIYNEAIKINQLYKNEYLMYNLNNNFNMENLFLCKNEKGYFYNWKNHQEQMDSIIPINNDHYILLSNRDGYYNYVYLGDTLHYSIEEKSPTELIEYLYSEKSYSSKLGKIKLNNTHSMIINFSESYFDQYETYDDYGDVKIEYNESIGTFATGIYNDQNNKWEILPKYEKIIPTETGYTAIIRTDKFFIEDSNNDGYSETRISKTNTYDLYDQNFNLVRQFNQDSNPYEDPMNFKYLVSNVDYDTIYELVNEHFEKNTLYNNHSPNTKTYQYYKKGKGYGCITHFIDYSTFKLTSNSFNVLNYNPNVDLSIGIKNDSLYINKLKLPITSQSTYEVNYYSNNTDFVVKETTQVGISYYWFNTNTRNWEKTKIGEDINSVVLDGVFSPTHCFISLIKDEVLISHYPETIYIYNDPDYIEDPSSIHTKFANDAVWRKINGQWKEVINEGTIEKFDSLYLLIKPALSNSFFNETTKEKTQIVDINFIPKNFGSYTNPVSYHALEKGYYFVEFRNESETNIKVVCFSPSGKVVSEEFKWYEIENEKIKGTTMLMDEYGEVMEERSDIFEMTE